MTDPRDPRNAPPDSPDQRLDEAIGALRDRTGDERELQRARQNAWQRLEAEVAEASTTACDELRADLTAWRTGQLSSARTALLERHGRECLPCRRLLRDGDAPLKAPVQTAGARSRRPFLRLAAAASILVAVGATGWLWLRGTDPAGSPRAEGAAATVIQLDGNLFSPRGLTPVAIAQGDGLAAGQVVRTGKGARALLALPDGSTVEMNERAELHLDASGDATTVRLTRGDVIVKAAKRKTRDLHVRTRELTASVKGTIFTVGHGLKGSRVGVIEGSVLVDAGGEEQPLLGPGEQVSTRGQLTDMALRDQVTWSRSVEEYSALLDEIEAVEAELAVRPFERDVRHESELLDGLPSGTVAYAAVPNVHGNVGRLVDLITDRVVDNPHLSSWWAAQAQAQRDRGQPTFDDVVRRLEKLSAALGEEVAIALVIPAGADQPAPVLLGRLVDQVSFRELVAETLGEGDVQVLGMGEVRTLAKAGSAGQLLVAVTDSGHVLAGPSAAVLAETASGLEASRGAFVGSPLHRSVSEQYRLGTELVVAVDLTTLIGRAVDAPAPAGGLERDIADLGLRDLQHFVLNVGGDRPGEAVLSFSGARSGLASWLASPAPMGSLSFVSPDAALATAVVFKDPKAMLEDLRVFVRGESFDEALDRFEAETGLDPVADVAAPLGGEMAFALDGPLLPTPAWKVVVEVYDPARLQGAIETLVRRANDWLAESADAGAAPSRLSLETRTTAEGKIHVLTHPELPWTIAFAHADGYLVATSSPFLLESALQAHRLGTSLIDAPQFSALLPKDGEPHFSLLAYQDLGSAVNGLLSGLAGPVAAAPSPGQSSAACLVHGRATDRSIRIAVDAPGAGLGARLAALLRQGLVRSLQQAAEAGLLESKRPADPGVLRYDGLTDPDAERTAPRDRSY